MKNKWIKTVILAAVFCMASASAAFASETTVAPSGDKTGVTDYKNIRDALAQYDEVKLEDGGQYYIGGKSTDGVVYGAINVDSNTTIDARGATVRQMNAGKGILKTTVSATAGGYDAMENVKIIGGTWIGNKSKASEYSLIKFFHGKNIEIKDAVFKDIYDGHLLELAGCKDVTVTGCYFGGTYGGSSSTDEAVQLDNCTKGCVTLNSEAQYDGTSCQDIVFEDNEVVFPRTVGSHNTNGEGKGKFMRNITIKNNKLTATADTGLLIFNWYDSTISGNTISGATCGVDVVTFFKGSTKDYTGGLSAAKKNNTKPYNVVIKNNKISTKRGTALRIRGIEERPISGITAVDNDLSTKAVGSGANVISVEWAKVNKKQGIELKNNKIRKFSVRAAVLIRNASGVNLEKQTFDVASKETSNVIYLCENAKKCTVKNNTLKCNYKNLSNGILIEGGSGNQVSGNKVTKANGCGISVKECTGAVIKNNQVSGSKTYDIRIQNCSKVTESGNKAAVIKKQ